MMGARWLIAILAPCAIQAQTASPELFSWQRPFSLRTASQMPRVSDSGPTPAQVKGWLAEDTLRLDLTRAVAIALTNATPVQLASDTIRLSGIALLESYGRFLPSLTGTVGAFGQNGTSLLSSTALAPTDAQFYGMGYQLQAGINLFNGFRDREHMRAAVSVRDAALSSYDRARQQVSFDVAQAFYQTVLDRRLDSVAQANLSLSQTRESQISEGVRVGTRAPPDLYRQQAQTRADEVAVIDAQNRERNDEAALLRRLEVDPLKPFRLVEPPADTTAIPADSLNVKALVLDAQRVRPDLAASRSRLSADQHALNEANGELLPQLGLSFAYLDQSRIFGRETLNGVNQLNNASQRNVLNQLGSQGVGVVQLGVSWNLFDDYRARLDAERAQAASSRDRISTQDLSLRIASEVQQAVGDYQSAENRLVSTAAGLLAAQQAYDAVEGRFEVGLASFVDVVSAQTVLTQARALREQALINFALQKAVLRYVRGQN